MYIQTNIYTLIYRILSRYMGAKLNNNIELSPCPVVLVPELACSVSC